MDGYVSGGYFLTRRVLRNDRFMSSELLPASFVTLSGCLADFALEFWWNHENVAGATRFGVNENRLPALIDWYREQFDRRLGAPNVAFSTDVISEFLQNFVDDTTGLVILGCGVSEEHQERLLQGHRTPEERGEYGVFKMLEGNHPLEPGGSALGFELMSYDLGLEHSWLCNSLEREVQSRYDIAPNLQTGLLESYEDAVTAADYISQDEVGAEPGTWLPWLVVQYPI